MEVRPCPDCKVNIGGTKHTLLQGNETAHGYVPLLSSVPRRRLVNEQKITGKQALNVL